MLHGGKSVHFLVYHLFECDELIDTIEALYRFGLFTAVEPLADDFIPPTSVMERDSFINGETKGNRKCTKLRAPRLSEKFEIFRNWDR